MGHLESLRFINGFRSIHAKPFHPDEITRVTKALIRAIQDNPNLSTLELSETHFFHVWAGTLENVFKAMEEHKGQQTVVLGGSPAMDLDWMEKLLSRNQNISVTDILGKRISNGSTIDKLYALNRVYNGSVLLMKEESTLWRPLLVASALTESCAENFRIQHCCCRTTWTSCVSLWTL